MDTAPPLELEAFRSAARAWLTADGTAFRPGAHDLDAEVARARALQRALFDAGWSRAGWPVDAGGFGGSPLLRACLLEEVAAAGLLTGTASTVMAFVEILGPAFLQYATPELRASMFPDFVSGRGGWCQGFSEPDAGSDLAAMRTTAVRDGDGWRLDGQKVWTSFAQYAQRCVVLARTGTTQERHRGISAFLVDMDSPGLVVQPITTISGSAEFCELFLDGVAVPADRIIGEVGGGWAVTMRILASERGTVMWQGSAWMAHRMQELAKRVGPDSSVDDRDLGETFLELHGVRARSRRTQLLLAAGGAVGPEASIDKVLMTTAEQRLFDLLRDVEPGLVELSTGDEADQWREEYFYSRAASIYGGTAEIQRSMIADRIVGLPREV